MVSDETTQNESIREVLKIESTIEGGCRELLDKEQALVRQGKLVASVAKVMGMVELGANGS